MGWMNSEVLWGLDPIVAPLFKGAKQGYSLSLETDRGWGGEQIWMEWDVS